MDRGRGDAVAADRGGVLNPPAPPPVPSAPLADWIAASFGRPPLDEASYARALTHGSRAAASYERLEFLGDRVLGLVMAEWLYAEFPAEPEGALTKRFNTLVTGAACADVARAIGVGERVRMGKQGHDDGIGRRDTVLGDVMEALLGAFYLEHGLDAARAAIRRRWGARIRAAAAVPQHPKSALQEWAAAHHRKPPAYALVERTGPDHAPRLTVAVTLGPRHRAVATGGSKQEAETAAAAALLAELTG